MIPLVGRHANTWVADQGRRSLRGSCAAGVRDWRNTARSLATATTTAQAVNGERRTLDSTRHPADDVLVPYVRPLLLRYARPSGGHVWRGPALEAVQLGTELPGQVRRLLCDQKRGALVLNVQPTEREPFMRHLARRIDRVSLSMLTAAFILGLAGLMLVYPPPDWAQGSGTVFAAGLGSAGGLVGYLL